MQIINTAIPEVLIIEPEIFGDARGFFLEVFQSRKYAACGVPDPFVQDNLSRSAQGVLRGLHLQCPNAQGKLVTVLQGTVLDVAVDVRVGSPTFGRHVAVELSADNRRQFWIPRGFAHGFVVLSEVADFFYKCDQFYSPREEIVIAWNDPDLAIDWGVAKPKLSARDSVGRRLKDVDGLPVYQSPALAMTDVSVLENVASLSGVR